ncbi:MAG TPA: DNA translocase FtsK 4TM domain-containing protein, partial [Gemmataceae bacterium]|nr:DNA translocase FtsK 4TM domain-containing protein [Gemmataceae bacterium]
MPKKEVMRQTAEPGEMWMTERRLLTLDGWAVGFAAVGAMLALCLVSHFQSGGVAADNWLGEPGRGLAETLLEGFGLAVYAMLTAWAVLAVHLVVWRHWGKLTARLAGWTILVLLSAVAADWWANEALADSGGTVGAWLAAWLDDSFVTAAQILLFSTMFGIGVVLATDYFVGPGYKAISWVLRGCWAVLRFCRGIIPANFEEQAPVPTAAPAVAATKPAKDDGIPIVRLTAVVPPGDKNDAVLVTPLIKPADSPALRIVRPGPVPDTERFRDYQLPPLSLLEDPQSYPFEQHDQHLRDQAALLEKTFKDFELNVHVVGINTGPVITQYEVSLDTGLRVNKVTCLA